MRRFQLLLAPSALKGAASVRKAAEFIPLINFQVFQLYKAVMGHLNIPPSYVIGKDRKPLEWPELYVGFKIGRYAQSLRAGLKENVYDDATVKKLQELGLKDYVVASKPQIQRSLREKRFELKFQALKAFHSIHGSYNVPYNFVVPSDDDRYSIEQTGIHLGHFLSLVQKEGSFPQHRWRFADLGITLDLPKREYDLIGALEGFKTQHGHLTVPTEFRVPALPEYPSSMWDKRLGATVWRVFNENRHTDWSDVFEELGLSTTNRRRDSLEAALAALAAYKAAHGHLDVPGKYVVGEEDERFPPETRGLALGYRVSQIRNRGLYAEHRQRFLDMGLKLTKEEKKTTGVDVVKTALETFRQVKGHVRVPTKFVVDGEAYPEETRGLNLGLRIRKVRYDGLYSEHRQWFEDMGVVFASAPKRTEEVVVVAARANKVSDPEAAGRLLLRAVESYKDIHGHVDVPRRYVCEGEQYPEEVRGVPLGQRLAQVRVNGHYAQFREQLAALGASVDTTRRRWAFPEIITALQAYKAASGGDMAVPESFTIEKGDPLYPEAAWGMPLGRYVVKIERGQFQDRYRPQLEELGMKLRVTSDRVSVIL